MQNGAKTYRLELGQDEMADVHLVISMNFFIERVDRDGSKTGRTLIKTACPPTRKARQLTPTSSI
jgi:hypothetical protein